MDFLSWTVVACSLLDQCQLAIDWVFGSASAMRMRPLLEIYLEKSHLSMTDLRRVVPYSVLVVGVFGLHQLKSGLLRRNQLAGGVQ